MYAARAAELLATYYSQSGSWQGVEYVMSALQRVPGDRLILTDVDGAILADTAQPADRSSNVDLASQSCTGVVVGGREIGRVYVDASGVDGGTARMGHGPGVAGGGPWWTRPEGVPPAGARVASPEERFLSSVNDNLWWAALASGLAAAALGFVLSWHIERPVRS